MKAQAQWTVGQRWLLAALCLLASFGFLGRTTSPEVTGPFSFIARPVAAVAAHQDQAGHDHSAGHAQPSGKSSEVAATPQHPATPRLTDAPPNAPPHTAGHGAHCPFCFTAAFALEAQGARSFQGGAVPERQQAPVARRPAQAPLRHAEPRAPPHLG